MERVKGHLASAVNKLTKKRDGDTGVMKANTGDSESSHANNGKWSPEAGRNVMSALRHRFLIGLKIVIPLGITLFVLFWVLNRIDNILQPIIGYFLDRRIPGLGLVAVVVLVLLIAIIMSTRPGRWVVYTGERLIMHIPVLRAIYNAVKQIVESFTVRAEGASFLYVVFIEFPKEGMRTLGLVTNQFTNDAGEKLLNVFIPTAPNPTSGFLEIVKADDVMPTKMSVDDALKMVMSAGKIQSPYTRESFDRILLRKQNY